MSEKRQIKIIMEVNNEDCDVVTSVTDSLVEGALGYTPMDAALKGANSGVAELDSAGLVLSSQLPSYVDDTIEGYYHDGGFYKESAHTTKINPESGKIYVDLTTNKTYRWSGTAFVVISETIALGETSSTAYRGDRGKIAYEHSQTDHAPSDAEKNQNAFGNISIGEYTINATDESSTLHIAAGNNVTITPDVSGKKITIASKNTEYSNASQSAAGLLSSTDKKKLDGIEEGANKYTLPTASNTLGGVKTTSTVTSNSGYTACPIISGVPYYQNTKYTHPSNTAYNSGLYKIAVDALGHVTGATAVAKSDITALGIPSDDTWRGIQNNLTSTSTTDSLSAAQGKVLNEKIGALKYAGSTSAGGVATSAAKVTNSLTIQGNGKDLASFNGSSAQTVNITPDNIGAAATSHGLHVEFSTTAPKANGIQSVGTATTVSRSDHVHPVGVATMFSTSQSITLTGDVTGTGSSQAGWSIPAVLSTTGVIAGKYGPTANATPSYGSTFYVPYIQVDAKGRITSATHYTVKIPASDNTDKNVASTTTNPTSSTTYYPTFVANSTVGDVKFNNGLKYTTKEGTTSAVGDAQLTVGNPTASGTAGNKSGSVQIYSSSTGSGTITQQSTTSSLTHYLPDSSGNLLNENNFNSFSTINGKLVYYGSSTTDGTSATKSVTGCSGFTLTSGNKLIVRFTTDDTAGKPLLNVMSLGAKPIVHNGYPLPAGSICADHWYEFVYYSSTKTTISGTVYTGAYHLVGECAKYSQIYSGTIDATTATITTTEDVFKYQLIFIRIRGCCENTYSHMPWTPISVKRFRGSTTPMTLDFWDAEMECWYPDSYLLRIDGENSISITGPNAGSHKVGTVDIIGVM